MKKIKRNTVRNNFFSIIVFSLIIISFGACSKKVSFMNSSVAPAARGDVQMSRDHNRNYVMNLDIFNLAESTRLTPSRSTYVVWLMFNDGTVKNVGQIKSSTGFMNKNLKATFKAVSATKPIKVFITAEDDGSVQNPAQQLVLTTDII